MFSPHSAAPFPSPADRLGTAHAKTRLLRERDRFTAGSPASGLLAQFLYHRQPYKLLRWALKATFLYERGRRNYLNLRVAETKVRLAKLPPAFDGFRILQLADLHLDLEPALLPIIRRRLSGVGYEATVFTGDFKNRTESAPDAALALLDQLLQSLRPPFYAVLGNHDTLEMVPLLEARGIRVLLNEHVRLTQGDASLVLAGVDDSYYFRTDDIPRALAGTSSDECRLLLSHAPDNYRAAAEAEVDYCLCGHTHGGQICTPRGNPYFLPSRIPPELVAGRWKHRQLHGYTSRGAGGGHLPVRFYCPPEITVHVLKNRTAA